MAFWFGLIVLHNVVGNLCVWSLLALFHTLKHDGFQFLVVLSCLSDVNVHLPRPTLWNGVVLETNGGARQTTYPVSVALILDTVVLY